MKGKLVFAVLLSLLLLAALLPTAALAEEQTDPADGAYETRAVSILKTDGSNNDLALAGATLQVLTGDRDDAGEWKETLIDEWVTGSEPHEVAGLRSDVEYILREKKAPEGYGTNNDASFTVGSDGNVECRFWDESDGEINQDGVLIFRDLPGIPIHVDFGEKHADFVSALFGGLDGVTIDGAVVTTMIEPGQTFYDVKRQLGGLDYEQIPDPVDNGERLMTDQNGSFCFGYQPRSAYATQEDYSRSEWSDGSGIDRELTVYALWADPVAATITVVPPACGTEVRYKYKTGIYVCAQPGPDLSVSEHCHFDDYELFYNNWDLSEYGITGIDSGSLTMTGGNSYKAKGFLAADWGYFIPDDCALQVEGGSLVSFRGEGLLHNEFVISVPVSHKVPDSAVTVNPTCEEAGSRTYTCAGCGEEVIEEIDALGHDWEFAGFTWTGDDANGYSAATANFKCGNDETHTKAVTANVTAETREAACEAKGTAEYTAAVSENDSPDGAAHTESKTVETAALGHDWVFTGFTWTGDDASGYSVATANYKCGNDETHTETVNANVTIDQTDAVCGEAGEIVFTATVTANESIDKAEHSESKTAEVEALDHDWGNPEYEWSEDLSSVTATRVCRRDESHVETETVDTVSGITKEATATEGGERTYIAAFENPAFGTQTKTKAIPATGESEPEPAAYTVIWLNGDGQVLDQKTWQAGEAEPETDKKPTKAADGTYTFVFDNKWNGAWDQTQTIRIYTPVFKIKSSAGPGGWYVPPSQPSTPSAPDKPAAPFGDIPQEDSELTDAVKELYDRGIMNGMSDTLFAPEFPLTRAMIVTVLYRLEGEPAVGYTGAFRDVPVGQWYTNGVEWAAAHRIVDGYGDGTFGVMDNVTREQLVTIFWRYAKYKGVDVSVGEDTNILSYDDAFDVSGWATAAMQWACGSNLLVLRSFSALHPGLPATRGEVAVFIARYCKLAGA